MDIFNLKPGCSLSVFCDAKGQCVAAEHESSGFQIASDAVGFTLRDLDSPLGTFINGVEVRGIARLRPGDLITHGKCQWVVPDPHVPGRGKKPHVSTCVKTAVGLRVDVRNAVSAAMLQEFDAEKQETTDRPILNDISCTIPAGAFVGILGTSGSGKSTFVKTIAGLVGLSGGEVRLDGQPKTRAELLSERGIAYLPQDVILHEQLTPIVALKYIVRLKGVEHEADHVERLAVEALRRVSLGTTDHTKRPIRKMSGGQRKRVALAAELLGNPQMLLLDEATSGLDPLTEEKMMQLFASLSKEGRTVVCITHFPGRLHQCDRILLLNSGKGIFYGTPKEMLDFFGVATIEDVFGQQEALSADVWEKRFQQEVGNRTALRGVESEGHSNTERLMPSHGRQGFLPPSDAHQFFLLCSRYCRLQAGDLRNLSLVCLQAPVIGLMIGLTYGNITVDFAELHAAKTKELCFLLVVAVLWCSGTASVREIVKEQAILRHEMRYGVRIIPYLISKVAVLGLISLLQTTLLLATVRIMTELPGAGLGQWLVLASCGVAGVAVGLVVSAAVGTAERAMSVLPVILIGQAILSGGLARISGACELLARFANPAWWAFDGLRATMSTALLHATYPGAPGYYQPPILGAGGPLGLDFVVLLLQTLAIAGSACWILFCRLNGGRG